MAPQSYAPKIIPKKIIFQIPKGGSQSYSKSMFESSSPKFFFKITTENYFPEFLVNIYPKVAIFQSKYSSKLFRKIVQSCSQSYSPKLFPKIIP